jgi:hypothetical protein
MAAGVVGRLEVDPAHGRVPEREGHDRADLVVVHAALDRRHEHDERATSMAGDQAWSPASASRRRLR